MLEDAHEDAGFKKFFDVVIVVTRLCALVLRSDHITGDLIRSLKILGKNVRIRANVARRLREWGTDVNR